MSWKKRRRRSVAFLYVCGLILTFEEISKEGGYMAQKAKFGSRIGLIAATVGSAVGLGNVWRFPAETQANGGAAFLLIYICCVMVLGIPVMLAEFSLGRSGQSDAEGAFRKLVPGRKWWLAGTLAIIASYLILSFYMVVAGWTLEYLWQSVTGSLYQPVAGSPGMEAGFKARMNGYIAGGCQSLITTYIMIGANLVILLLGVQKGIERMSNIMMPLLFLLLLIFCGVALTLPEAGEGLKFFFSPDFSKIDSSVVVNALGQAFFSLSLGMGILITYSAYYPKTTKLGQTALTVSMLDLLVAVMMGVIIFPAVMSFGLGGGDLEGATLVFVTLPEVFTQLPATRLWSILFFLLLLVAALTSTISLAEVSVAYLQDHFGRSRKSACIIVVAPLFILSGLCALSFGPLADWKIVGMTIFDFLDTTATNIMLPTVAILVCLFIGWIAPKDILKKQITNDGTTGTRLYPAVRFILRYVAPLLLLVILITEFMDM